MEKLNEMALRNPEIAAKLDGLMHSGEKLDEFLDEHPELKQHIGGSFKDLQDQMAAEIAVMKDKMSDELTHLQDEAYKEIKHAQEALPGQVQGM